MLDVDQLDIEKAKQLVAGAVPEFWPANALFFGGDHWQDAEGWIGPLLAKGDPASSITLREIEKAFTPKNAIREVVARHRDAAGGREVRWYLAPIEAREELRDVEDEAERTRLETAYAAEDDLIADLEAELTAWWDDRQAPEYLRTAIDHVLLAGRGPLRLYVPAGLLEPIYAEGSSEDDEEREITGYVVPRVPFAEALDLIWLDAPTPDNAVLHVDPDTKERVAIVIQKIDDHESAEVAYLDDDGRTVLRVIDRNTQPADDEEGAEVFALDLQGRLPVFELTRAPLITDPVRRQQRALNLANSTIPRNVITAGFLERILLNVQLPGTSEPDPETGGIKYKPDPLYVGPNTTNVFQGSEVTDADGKVSRANPSVVFRDPVDPEPAIKAKDSHYADILFEVDQVHVLISGDATASGVSRQQARGGFEGSLLPTASQAEAAVRWILETVIALAEAFSQQRAVEGLEVPALDRFRAVAQAVLHLGPVSDEERERAAAEAEDGLRSQESAMEAIGIQDVDAELARIRRQPGSIISLRQEWQAVILEFVREGMSWALAARAAGIDDPGLIAIFEEQDEAAAEERERTELEDEEIEDARRSREDPEADPDADPVPDEE